MIVLQMIIMMNYVTNIMIHELSIIRDYYVNANGQTVKVDSSDMGRRGHHLHVNEHEHHQV